jgi:hypothetical protein
MHAQWVAVIAKRDLSLRRFRDSFITPRLQSAWQPMQIAGGQSGKRACDLRHQPTALMKNLECIHECYVCVSACESCLAAGPAGDEAGALEKCRLLARSCSDACVFAAREMARESPFADEVCAVCARICKACGDACAEHPGEVYQRCAAACHRCADRCRLTAA